VERVSLLRSPSSANATSAALSTVPWLDQCWRRAQIRIYAGALLRGLFRLGDDALENSIELARQDGTEYRSVRLSLDDDGTIRIDAHDMRPAVERAWDHEDYEYSVEVQAPAVARLAVELLREKFTGDVGAVDSLRSFCETHGIAYRFDSWP
jgi:hypothetical protein